MKAVVTIKLPGKGKWHNPKIQGKCPVNGNSCSDSNNLHHSFVVEGNNFEEIKEQVGKTYHITRIEEI